MAGKPPVITRVVDSMTENLRPTRAEATDVPVQYWMTVVAALASDPNVWNAVWENKALQELLQSQNASESVADKEYVADNESVGDTDSQDAAVSSKNLTELSDDESETGNSQTGLMDVINNVKLTVVDMVTNVSAYFKKIFTFSSAEHTPDAADENAGSSTTGKTLAASLMALAVIVIMVVVLRRP
ncbi:pyruvate kinase-like isoform X6 [Populus alba x Populus x berolinensis]|nr:pyruvate kinase-like isoform X6 [Populus alba x Populus x berolinensis]